MTLHKKKLKLVDTNFTTNAIHTIDRQHSSINLVRTNLFKTRVAEPVDAITNAE